MRPISDDHLATLISGLELYKLAGVSDPWVLSDGTMIEPLDVLLELQMLRGGGWRPVR